MYNFGGGGPGTRCPGDRTHAAFAGPHRPGDADGRHAHTTPPGVQAAPALIRRSRGPLWQGLPASAEIVIPANAVLVFAKDAGD